MRDNEVVSQAFRTAGAASWLRVGCGKACEAKPTLPGLNPARRRAGAVATLVRDISARRTRDEHYLNGK